MKLTQEQIDEKVEAIMSDITDDDNLCTIRDALNYYFETIDED